MSCDKSLSGVWRNELGSRMILQQSTDGDLSGCYNTAVGHAKNLYSLVGKTNLHLKAVCDKASVGFTVAYQNDHFGDSMSVCSWSGKYQLLDSQEIIETTWLLTRERSHESNWDSTLVGKNSFTRVELESWVLEEYDQCMNELNENVAPIAEL